MALTKRCAVIPTSMMWHNPTFRIRAAYYIGLVTQVLGEAMRTYLVSVALFRGCFVGKKLLNNLVCDALHEIAVGLLRGSLIQPFVYLYLDSMLYFTNMLMR